MIRTTLAALAGVLFSLIVAGDARAQQAAGTDLQTILQDNVELVADASRRTVQQVLDILVDSQLPEVPEFLATWQAREVYQRDSDGLFVYVEDPDADPLTLIDITTGDVVGTAGSREVTQLRPNRGVQGVIAATLVQFQLSSDDPAQRLAALDAIEDDPEEEHLALLEELVQSETDPQVLDRAELLLPALVIAFSDEDAPRVDAIRSLAGNVSLTARATLNPLLVTRTEFAETLPEDANIARELDPGSEALSVADAYAMLVDEGLAPALIPRAEQVGILAENIVGGAVGGVPVDSLNSEAARDRAYAALVEAGAALPAPSEADVAASLGQYVFYEVYREDSVAVTTAARETLDGIETRVGFYRFLDLSLDGISLASIYFLAAIGLAITFGVMGVINMAHGEFIMIGAYTGYVVQTLVPN
jgi:urea transport system permease protein